MTPSLNQGAFIEQTLRSVKDQTYRNIEHIIIDGGSTDDTLEVLRRYESCYNLIWISEPDRGHSDALNKGFQKAKGHLVGWLNSDDVYIGDWVIERVVSEFAKHEAVDVIYGGDVLIDAGGNILRARPAIRFRYQRVLRICGISQPAAFFRKSVVAEHQVRIDLPQAMDHEYWLRLGKTCKFRHMDSILAAARVHASAKQFARSDEMRRLTTSVKEEHGLKTGLPTVLQGLFYDKLSLAVRRIRGLGALNKMRSGTPALFSFVIPPRTLTETMKRQLFRGTRPDDGRTSTHR